jgi:hypothetical protein
MTDAPRQGGQKKKLGMYTLRYLILYFPLPKDPTTLPTGTSEPNKFCFSHTDFIWIYGCNFDFNFDIFLFVERVEEKLKNHSRDLSMVQFYFCFYFYMCLSAFWLKRKEN